MSKIRSVLPHIPRVLLGLAMTAFGLMGLFLNMEPPPTLSPEALAFGNALKNSGYMNQMIALVQIVSGIALLANRFVPLALLLLAPFFVNAVLFHAFLEHSGLVPSLVFTALHLGVAWQRRESFASVLRVR